MKFIIPQNYNFKAKLLGFIDYSTAILNVVWVIIIFTILNFIFTNWNIKIFLFITLCFPIFLLSMFGFNGENFIYIVKYMITYIIRPKLYLFKK